MLIANKLIMLNVIMLSVENKPFMLSVFMLNVVMLSVENKPFMLSVFMLNAIMLRAVMSNVLAPFLLQLVAFLRRISPM
jgi:hypothetical protein